MIEIVHTIEIFVKQRASSTLYSYIHTLDCSDNTSLYLSIVDYLVKVWWG